MTLPGVWRIVDRQTRLEDRASARTASACDGRIDDTHPGILFFVVVKQGVQRRRFTAGGPPGKDFEFWECEFDKLARPFILRLRGRIQIQATGERIVSGRNSKCGR